MDLVKFLCTIGSVIIVGFLINLITQKSKAERNIERIEKELKTLSEEISFLNKAAESTADISKQKANALDRELAGLKLTAQKIMSECDSILLSYDGMLEKLMIISEAFSNPNISDTEKKALVQDYTKRLTEDVNNNRQVVLRLQNQGRGKGHAR